MRLSMNISLIFANAAQTKLRLSLQLNSIAIDIPTKVQSHHPLIFYKISVHKFRAQQVKLP